MAGLAPAEPGYRKILFRSRPGGGLLHASARHLTPYGLAESRWSIEGQTIHVSVIVPPNTTASVFLPGRETEAMEVGSGMYNWSYSYQDPDTHGPLSVDDPISEIADVTEAWAAVQDAIARLSPESHFLKFGLQTYRRTSLRQALASLPNAEEVLKSISQAFSQL